jgi:hypothetical protein
MSGTMTHDIIALFAEKCFASTRWKRPMQSMLLHTYLRRVADIPPPRGENYTVFSSLNAAEWV